MGARERKKVLCTREYQTSIADSVHALLAAQVTDLGLDGFYEVKKQEIIGRNGTQFIFAGLRRDPKKIKSTEGVDIAWVEEADTISNESLDLLIPTIRKPGSEIWFSFNPDQETDPVYDRFVAHEREDAVVRHITYQDNPFFTDANLKELEWDKANDYQKYLNVWEGQLRAFTDAQVFAGKWRTDNFETPEGVTFYYGADWGFSQDPTALVRCFIQDDVLYVDYEAYGVGVDIDDTPELFRSVPGADRWPITADSARPETISFMNKNGFKVRGAHKGKGSVEDGVQFLRGFREIVVHERCKHTADEMKHYSYKVDKLTGDILPVLEDAHNHCIDALRYATEGIRRNNGQVSKISAGRLGL
jgi:phage terminase large subunit